MIELPETVSTAEQAEAAGRIRSPELDPIDVFRLHCERFMESLGGDQKGHAMLQAKPKLEEFIFWLRAHVSATRRSAL